jgi:hypothetical protein
LKGNERKQTMRTWRITSELTNTTVESVRLQFFSGGEAETWGVWGGAYSAFAENMGNVLRDAKPDVGHVCGKVGVVKYELGCVRCMRCRCHSWDSQGRRGKEEGGEALHVKGKRGWNKRNAERMDRD